jgi:hypothetical protein
MFHRHGARLIDQPEFELATGTQNVPGPDLNGNFDVQD